MGLQMTSFVLLQSVTLQFIGTNDNGLICLEYSITSLYSTHRECIHQSTLTIDGRTVAHAVDENSSTLCSSDEFNEFICLDPESNYRKFGFKSIR